MDLASQKMSMIVGVDSDTGTYITSRYDLGTQISLNMLTDDARANNLSNRLTYLLTMRTWLMTVLQYTISVETSINTAPDQATLSAITWDFYAFSATDPAITISGALAISD